MRSRVPRSRVTHDRWLVSYADFITLLFAFFVVLYAFANAGQSKQKQVSEAIDSALSSMGAFSSKSQGAAARALPPTKVVAAESVQAPAQVKEDLERIRRELTHILAGPIAARAVSIQMSRDGLVISLREAGFFASGSADPKPEALPMLRQIAASLGSSPYDVRVEGHTDDVPIHNILFGSNWELSSARATRIARLFLDLKAIPPERLSAAGYAEYHPVASNATAEGRAQNRRVDLVVLPRMSLNFAASGASGLSGPWRKITDDD